MFWLIRIVCDLEYYIMCMHILMYVNLLLVATFVYSYIVCIVVIRAGRGRQDTLAFIMSGRSSDVGTK